MNNFEKIKDMDMDQMAEFIFSMIDCVSCTSKLHIKPDCDGDGRKCLSVIKEWLMEEPMTVVERFKKQLESK